MPCEKKNCTTKCKALIDAELEVNPQVCCQPLKIEKGKFEIDLFLNSKPKCRIVESRKHESKGCTTGCTFFLEFEWPCDVVVRPNKCHKPRAQFLLEVFSEYKIDCDLVKNFCEEKEEKKEEKKEENREEKHEEKHEKKEERKCHRPRKH